MVSSSSIGLSIYHCSFLVKKVIDASSNSNTVYWSPDVCHSLPLSWVVLMIKAIYYWYLEMICKILYYYSIGINLSKRWVLLLRLTGEYRRESGLFNWTQINRRRQSHEQETGRQQAILGDYHIDHIGNHWPVHRHWFDLQTLWKHGRSTRDICFCQFCYLLSGDRHSGCWHYSWGNLSPPHNNNLRDPVVRILRWGSTWPYRDWSVILG